ncbi:MAG: aminotransferase class IV [Thermodesulfobacteriota bacterium]
MNRSGELDHPVLWLNGRLVSEDEARISPFDRGWLYGDGLFETMRAEQGLVLYLADHLHRLTRSAAFLGIPWNHALDWAAIFRELLFRNGLRGEVAAAKIVLTRGVAAGLGLPAAESPTVCLTVRKYEEPDDSSYRAGWRLTFFREGYAPPLARHKTLNYLYYLTARQNALDRGYDEAIVLDAQGRVSEAAAGSLLVRIDGTWFRPGPEYQLPGITATRASELLRIDGESVSQRDLAPRDVAQAETIWVCNSLMGVMPVTEVEGEPVCSPAVEQASRVRQALFARGRCCASSQAILIEPTLTL